MSNAQVRGEQYNTGCMGQTGKLMEDMIIAVMMQFEATAMPAWKTTRPQWELNPWPLYYWCHAVPFELCMKPSTLAAGQSPL